MYVLGLLWMSEWGTMGLERKTQLFVLLSFLIKLTISYTQFYPRLKLDQIGA